MSAQSVEMEERHWAEIRRALSNQEIEEIRIRESKPNDMSYWMDTLIDAAGMDSCNVIAEIQDGKILSLRIEDGDESA